MVNPDIGKPVRFARVEALPQSPLPNMWYTVLDRTTGLVTTYITGSDAIPREASGESVAVALFRAGLIGEPTTEALTEFVQAPAVAGAEQAALELDQYIALVDLEFEDRLDAADARVDAKLVAADAALAASIDDTAGQVADVLTGATEAVDLLTRMAGETLPLFALITVPPGATAIAFDSANAILVGDML